MDMNEYQNQARTTANTKLTADEALLNWALGLGGECGEFQNLVKKYLFHHVPVSGQALAEELGDVLWYLAMAANAVGYTLADIAIMNTTKLAQRYPQGFDAGRARDGGQCG